MAIINDRTAVTTPVTADALFATAIGAAAATKASFAEMGGLEVDEQTPSGNITGAVGKHYIITTTSLAADMDITVPSASVGERMRVTCVTDEPDYEIIIKGAASQTINGGSAATEWSRIFIAGETVELVCTAANTWWVCHDGRIPCSFRVGRGTDQANPSANTWTPVQWDTDHDTQVGAVFDITTNYELKARRAATWHLSWSIQSDASPGADQHFRGLLTDKDATFISGMHSQEADDAQGAWINNSTVLALTDGQRIEVEFQSESGNESVDLVEYGSYFAGVEIL